MSFLKSCGDTCLCHGFSDLAWPPSASSAVFAWRSRVLTLSAAAEGCSYTDTCSLQFQSCEYRLGVKTKGRSPSTVLLRLTAGALFAKLNTSARRNVLTSLCNSYTSYVEVVRARIISAGPSFWHTVCFLYVLVDTPVCQMNPWIPLATLARSLLTVKRAC